VRSSVVKKRESIGWTRGSGQISDPRDTRQSLLGRASLAMEPGQVSRHPDHPFTIARLLKRANKVRERRKRVPVSVIEQAPTVKAAQNTWPVSIRSSTIRTK